MSRLYDLLPAYLELQTLAEEGADVSEALAKLEDDLERKALSIVHVRNSLVNDALACAAEAKRLSERSKRLDAQAERLEQHVLTAMQVHGVTRIKAPTVTISIAQCPERVEVDEITHLPPELVREKTTYAPDKAAIMSLYKAHGEIPKGVRIERGVRLQVK